MGWNGSVKRAKHEGKPIQQRTSHLHSKAGLRRRKNGESVPLDGGKRGNVLSVEETVLGLG